MINLYPHAEAINYIDVKHDKNYNGCARMFAHLRGVALYQLGPK
jgi:hypothetical protein